MKITHILKKHVKNKYKKVKKLTPEQLADIQEMHEMNCTLACIAEEVGCSISTVWYYVQSPKTRKRIDEQHSKSHSIWQKKQNMYKRIKSRYMDMHEKDMLE